MLRVGRGRRGLGGGSVPELAAHRLQVAEGGRDWASQRLPLARQDRQRRVQEFLGALVLARHSGRDAEITLCQIADQGCPGIRR